MNYLYINDYPVDPDAAERWDDKTTYPEGNPFEVPTTTTTWTL